MSNPAQAQALHEIVVKGKAVYERIQGNYGPEHKGKYLAIEPDSGRAYLGDRGVEAIEKAKMENPGKIFYILKIGFDSTETLSETIFWSK